MRELGRIWPGALVLFSLDATAQAADSMLSNGSFEEVSEDGLPEGWTLTEGATTNGRRTSVVEVRSDAPMAGQHSLYFRGDRRTGHWQAAVSPTVPVQPGELLFLSAALRTQDLALERHQFRNCGIGLSFRDAQGEGLLFTGDPGGLEGTHDWSSLSTAATAPEGSVHAQASVFCSMSGEAWFDDLRLVRQPPLPWRVTETERMVFYDQDASQLTEEDRAKTLANLESIEATLGLEMTQQAHFYHYRDREQKTLYTGIDGNAHAIPPDELHTIWPVDHHELVHLVASVGGPAHSPLLGEGLAVGLANDWNGHPLEYRIHQFVDDGDLPALVSIDTRIEFRAQSSLVTYPVAGSFVHFLIQRNGMETFQQAYFQDHQRTLDAILREAYSVGLGELEREWHASLELSSDSPAGPVQPR